MTNWGHWMTLSLLATAVWSGCGGSDDSAIGTTGKPSDATGGDIEVGGELTGDATTDGKDVASAGTAGTGAGESATSGSGTGGSGTGGSGTGGSGTGGSGTGGSGTGGSGTGGSGTGGSGTGGSGTGGSGTGGSGTGGSGTGGSGTGGSGIGGSGIGGSGTGGSGIAGEHTAGGGTGGEAAASGADSAGSTGIGGTAGTPASSCLDGITDYSSNGPFRYSSESSGNVKMLIPDVPAGCKVPMVHYSNGTFGTCTFYSALLVRLASHGFLALCYEDMNTGAGRYGIEAFEAALSQYPELADHKFGSTGHSQGGMASLVTLQYAEAQWGKDAIYAGLAMEPASGFGDTPSESWQTLYAQIQSPVFMFSGLVTDTLVIQAWVQQAFDALDDSTEAYFWAKSGANHITTINQDGNEVLIPWFRWKLLGDRNACQYLKDIPANDASWTTVDAQNEVTCE